MTAEDDANVILLFLMMFCLPLIADGCVYLSGIGFRCMSHAEADAMLLALSPVMIICFICFMIMGIGLFVDSGGFGV